MIYILIKPTVINIIFIKYHNNLTKTNKLQVKKFFSQIEFINNLIRD